MILSTYNPRSWSSTVSVSMLAFAGGVRVFIQYQVAGLSVGDVAAGQQYFDMEAARLVLAIASGQIEEAAGFVEADTRGRRRALVTRIILIYGGLSTGSGIFTFVIGFFQTIGTVLLLIGVLMLVFGVYRAFDLGRRR